MSLRPIDTAISAIESVVMSSSAKEETKARRRTASEASEKERLLALRCSPSAFVRRKIFKVIAARIISPKPAVRASIFAHWRSLARRVALPMSMSRKGAMGSVAKKSNAESGSKTALTARMKGTSTANDMAVGTTV